ncbi:hypothetical protein ALC60_11927 [Trachymyrmex zeteki]|uniref:Ig-like domain-containing protein n=1 Tax=Mycetomoellerius zeteki TaxID=64791 RepID=A0A151WLX7_9HYME|nr:hypothetical protein ALC60_11927 [Trachymyrmex zeteki]
MEGSMFADAMNSLVEDVVVEAGKNVTLGCPGVTEDSLVLMLEWRANGMRLLEYKSRSTTVVRRTEQNRMSLSLKNYSLQLHPVTAADSGMYECLVNNRNTPEAVIKLIVRGYRRVSTICDRGEIFAIQYEYWVQQRCNAAKESFRFHRTNDIVKHSIIPAVRQRSYHDNTADDIIRIMFAARRRKIGSLVEEKEDQAGGKRVNFTRERQKFRRTFKAFNIKRPDREREREGKKSELPRSDRSRVEGYDERSDKENRDHEKQGKGKEKERKRGSKTVSRERCKALRRRERRRRGRVEEGRSERGEDRAKLENSRAQQQLKEWRVLRVRQPRNNCRKRELQLSRLSFALALRSGSSPAMAAGDVGQQDLSYLMTQLDRLGWQAERAEF